MRVLLWNAPASGVDAAGLRESLRAYRPREVCAPLDALPQYQDALRQADLLLVLADRPGDADWAALEAAAALLPAAGAVLLCAPLSAQALRQAMRVGVRLALEWPVEAAALDDELGRIASQLHRDGAPQGRVMTFCSAGGGSGVSLLAANFAALCAQPGRRRVLLFDLCQGFANSHLYLLNRLPVRTALDLCGQNERLDPALFAAGVISVSAEFDLLPSPPDPVAAGEMEGGQIEAILAQACQLYDLVVIDIGQRYSPLSMSALDISSEVGVVLQADLQHLASVHRLCEMLQGLGVPRDRLSLWLNRYDARRSTLDPAVFRQKLAVERLFVLPDDPKPVARSVVQGQPLLAAAGPCPLVQALQTAVAKFWPQAGEASPPGPRLRWPSLFSRS